MADVLIDESSMEGIAEAIREKNPDAGLMLASEMPDAIRAISGGSNTEAPLNLFVSTWDKAETLQSIPTASRPKINGFTISTTTKNACVSVKHGCGSITNNTARPYVRFGATSGDGIGVLKGGGTYRLQCDIESKLYSGYTGTATRYVSMHMYTRAPGVSNTQLFDERPISYRGDYGVVKAGKVDVTFALPEGTTGLYLQATPTTTTEGLFAEGDYVYVRNIMLTEVDGYYMPAPEDISSEATGSEADNVIIIPAGALSGKAIKDVYITATMSSGTYYLVDLTYDVGDDIYTLLDSHRLLSMDVSFDSLNSAGGRAYNIGESYPNSFKIEKTIYGDSTSTWRIWGTVKYQTWLGDVSSAKALIHLRLVEE